MSSLPFIIHDDGLPILRLNEDLTLDIDWGKIEGFARAVFTREACKPIAEATQVEALLVTLWIIKAGVLKL